MMKFNDQDRQEDLSMHQACHSERSEESDAPGTEILRGVYPERSEWAQNDNLLPVLVVKNHYRLSVDSKMAANHLLM